MHHPSRPQLPPRLFAMLGPTPRARHFRVVTDPQPITELHKVSPWRTFQRCLHEAPPGCTHYLILQDDVLPCRRFLWAAVEAIRHRPTEIISFFVNDLAHASSTMLVQNAQTCLAWSPLHPTERFVPTLALALPRGLVDDLAVYHTDAVNPIADDEIVGRWRRERGLPVWLTVPNLVQHDEEAPSVLLGHRDSRPRWAACFIGSHSPALIDWTRGL